MGGARGEGVVGAGPAAHLEKADEVAQHQAIDARQRVHHRHGGLGALVVRDALLVELVRDQGLLQLPVPQLQQRRCGHSTGVQPGPGAWHPCVEHGAVEHSPEPRGGRERGNRRPGRPVAGTRLERALLVKVGCAGPKVSELLDLRAWAAPGSLGDYAGIDAQKDFSEGLCSCCE